MPDIYYAYGNNLYELGLDDNRTVMHEQRFMLSNNILDPKVYQVTKVTDLNPSGVIKYSIKQDELDNKRDNVELQICDYYTDSGDQKTETIQKPQMMITKSQIRWLTLNDDGELEPLYDKSKQYLYLGMNSYFEYKLPYQDLKSEWNLSVYDRKNELELDAIILWELHTQLGLGPKRLKKFFDGFSDSLNALVNRYEMDISDDVWLCTHKLKEIGVDVEDWYRQKE